MTINKKINIITTCIAKLKKLKQQENDTNSNKKFGRIDASKNRMEYLQKFVLENFSKIENDSHTFGMTTCHYSGKIDSRAQGLIAVMNYKMDSTALKEICCEIQIVDPVGMIGLFYENYGEVTGYHTNKNANNEEFREAHFGPGKIDLATWKQTYGFAALKH